MSGIHVRSLRSAVCGTRIAPLGTGTAGRRVAWPGARCRVQAAWGRARLEAGLETASPFTRLHRAINRRYFAHNLMDAGRMQGQPFRFQLKIQKKNGPSSSWRYALACNFTRYCSRSHSRSHSRSRSRSRSRNRPTSSKIYAGRTPFQGMSCQYVVPRSCRAKTRLPYPIQRKSAPQGSVMTSSSQPHHRTQKF